MEFLSAACLLYRVSVGTALLLLPCILAVTFTWSPALAIALRPWIHLPWLPYLNWNKAVPAEVLRGISPLTYVLIVEIFQWGWSFGGGFLLLEGLRHGFRHNPNLSVAAIAYFLLLYSLAGAAVGYVCWRKQREAIQRP